MLPTAVPGPLKPSLKHMVCSYFSKSISTTFFISRLPSGFQIQLIYKSRRPYLQNHLEFVSSHLCCHYLGPSALPSCPVCPTEMTSYLRPHASITSSQSTLHIPEFLNQSLRTTNQIKSPPAHRSHGAPPYSAAEAPCRSDARLASPSLLPSTAPSPCSRRARLLPV